MSDVPVSGQEKRTFDMVRFIMLKCSKARLGLNFLQWQECLMLFHKAQLNSTEMKGAAFESKLMKQLCKVYECRKS